jgi:cell wall-associated NlpC family hydrolase
MKRALRSLVVMLTLVFTLNVTAFAIPTNDKLQKQKDLLSKIQAEREEIEIKIEEFDNEVEKIMAKTEQNKVKIAETEKAIKSAVAEIKQVEKEAQAEQELFNKRMRTLYINGFDGYISILLESETIGDFISRVENVKAVVEFDQELVAGFKATKEEISKKQQGLTEKKSELLGLQVENKQKLDKMIITKELQSKLITELKSKEIMLVGQISAPQVLVNKTITKINEIRKATPKYTPSRGSASLSGNAVIAYASNFLGTPYLWGGTSPSTGFDCSGFTQYVYSHFGISVGRTTHDQINDGVQVSRANLKAGDLVFFGRGGSPNHMGIYVGDNTYIHSPRTGDVIKVSAMTRSDYITGRRVN